MMRWWVTAAAALGLAACASVDRPAMTEFEPLGESEFRYEATADVVYPAESATAEAERMSWLETYLADNSLCPSGYEITERKPVLVQQAALGDVHRIYYTGTCR